MTEAAMPEPFGWLIDSLPNGQLAFSRQDPTKITVFIVNSTASVFTGPQMEAYAAAKVREALGWQPIETAPKDGFPVLLFARLESATASTRVTGHFLKGEWLSQSYIGQGKAVLIPSHWMPLPPFPQYDNEQENEMGLTRYEHENIKNKIDGYMVSAVPQESREQEFERAKSELLQALRLQIQQVEEFTYPDLFLKVS